MKAFPSLSAFLLLIAPALALASAFELTHESGPEIGYRSYEGNAASRVQQILFGVSRGIPHIALAFSDDVAGSHWGSSEIAGLTFDKSSRQITFQSAHGPVVCGSFVHSFRSYLSRFMNDGDWQPADFKPTGNCTALVELNSSPFSQPENWITIRLSVPWQ